MQATAKRKREKWTEVRNEDGEPVERLMVNCTECGQPQPRQRVLRLNERERREWYEGNTTLECWIGLTCVGTVVLGFVTFVVLTLASKSLIVGPIASAVITAVYYSFVSPRCRRFEKEHKERKRRILMAHGDIPEEKVGTPDEYWKEYIILPAT